MPTKTVKRMLCFIVIGLLLIGAVLADEEIEVIPTAEDFTCEEILDLAASFFAEKCGFDKEALKKEEVYISFRQVQERHFEVDGTMTWHWSEPRWVIQFKSFPGDAQHDGAHYLTLYRNGDLLSWSAHGAEFEELSPNIMATAIEAQPLTTDKQKDEIIDQMSRLLALKGSDKYTYQAFFIYSQYFNSGKIPVWLTFAYDDNNVLCWKGAYAYNGRYMSLTPPEQDFESYHTAGEDFWSEVYGVLWHYEKEFLWKIRDGKLSETEKEEKLNKWKTDFENWAVDHPYSTAWEDILEIIGEKMNCGS